MPMGLVHKKVKLTTEKEKLEVDALIDTGTNRLLIPKEVAEKLGIKPMFKVKAELANGSVREVDAGPVYVEIMGRGGPRMGGHSGEGRGLRRRRNP